MDREQIKAIIIREFDQARRAGLQPNFPEHIENFAQIVSNRLIDETEWNAKVSAGFDPDRRCFQCHGPIEESCTSTCLKCTLITLLRGSIQIHSEGLETIQNDIMEITRRVAVGMRETFSRLTVNFNLVTEAFGNFCQEINRITEAINNETRAQNAAQSLSEGNADWLQSLTQEGLQETLQEFEHAPNTEVTRTQIERAMDNLLARHTRPGRVATLTGDTDLPPYTRNAHVILSDTPPPFNPRFDPGSRHFWVNITSGIAFIEVDLIWEIANTTTLAALGIAAPFVFNILQTGSMREAGHTLILGNPMDLPSYDPLSGDICIGMLNGSTGIFLDNRWRPISITRATQLAEMNWGPEEIILSNRHTFIASIIIGNNFPNINNAGTIFINKPTSEAHILSSAEEDGFPIWKRIRDETPEIERILGRHLNGEQEAYRLLVASSFGRGQTIYINQPEGFVEPSPGDIVINMRNGIVDLCNQNRVLHPIQHFQDNQLEEFNWTDRPQEPMPRHDADSGGYTMDQTAGEALVRLGELVGYERPAHNGTHQSPGTDPVEVIAETNEARLLTPQCRVMISTNQAINPQPGDICISPESGRAIFYHEQNLRNTPSPRAIGFTENGLTDNLIRQTWHTEPPMYLTINSGLSNAFGSRRLYIDREDPEPLSEHDLELGLGLQNGDIAINYITGRAFMMIDHHPILISEVSQASGHHLGWHMGRNPSEGEENESPVSSSPFPLTVVGTRTLIRESENPSQEIEVVEPDSTEMHLRVTLNPEGAEVTLRDLTDEDEDALLEESSPAPPDSVTLDPEDIENINDQEVHQAAARDISESADEQALEAMSQEPERMVEPGVIVREVNFGNTFYPLGGSPSVWSPQAGTNRGRISTPYVLTAEYEQMIPRIRRARGEGYMICSNPHGSFQNARIGDVLIDTRTGVAYFKYADLQRNQGWAILSSRNHGDLFPNYFQNPNGFREISMELRNQRTGLLRIVDNPGEFNISSLEDDDLVVNTMGYVLHYNGNDADLIRIIEIPIEYLTDTYIFTRARNPVTVISVEEPHIASEPDYEGLLIAERPGLTAQNAEIGRIIINPHTGQTYFCSDLNPTTWTLLDRSNIDRINRVFGAERPILVALQAHDGNSRTIHIPMGDQEAVPVPVMGDLSIGFQGLASVFSEEENRYVPIGSCTPEFCFNTFYSARIDMSNG